MRLHVTPSVGGTRRKSGSFEAFFTANPQGSGTGLGLEIVHRIACRWTGRRKRRARQSPTEWILSKLIRTILTWPEWVSYPFRPPSRN